MTAPKAGALIRNHKTWYTLDWDKAWKVVRRLQRRIAKATKDKIWGKVKALQWILTHSHYAKALAVKRVTSNKGKKTPGVDGILWETTKQKVDAINSLNRHGYKSKPLRRIYIEKKSSGKYRPLSIPTMKDRAMQALHKLGLTPLSETTAGPHSYGFRPYRSCADAIGAVFNALSKPNSATWVFEADIAGCFDNISKQWLLDNIPMDKRILNQWLCAGYMEKGKMYPTLKGTPQGGIASPVLANMTLDGWQEVLLQATPRRKRVNFVRYADDFIVTGKSKEILETSIIPVVKKFLAERGLTLSKEKSKITYIRDGFTFLGQRVRKKKGELHITPDKTGTLNLVKKLGKVIRKYVSRPIEGLFRDLNRILRGWANYHRFVVSGKAFEFVDFYVYNRLWRMLRKRHHNKSVKWLINKYWEKTGKISLFTLKRAEGKKNPQILNVRSIGYKRHRKIKAEANPYLVEYFSYFKYRTTDKDAKFLTAMTSREMHKLNDVKWSGYPNRVTLKNARAE